MKKETYRIKTKAWGYSIICSIVTIILVLAGVAL